MRISGRARGGEKEEEEERYDEALVGLMPRNYVSCEYVREQDYGARLAPNRL